MAGGRAWQRPDLEYKDYYAVLGVPKTASQAEIKKAFRKLARQHHPDAKPGDAAAERRFKEINEANEVLCDPDKRKQYDELGANWEADQPGRGGRAAVRRGRPFGGFAVRAGRRQRPLRVPHDRRCRRVLRLLPDVLRRGRRDRDLAGSAGRSRHRGRPAGLAFEDILAGMGIDGRVGGADRREPARAGAAQPRPVHEATAEITLEEAFHGTTRLVDVDGKRLEITIPPGADTGTRIKLTGHGPGGGDLVRRRQESCRTHGSPDAAPTSSASCR